LPFGDGSTGTVTPVRFAASIDAPLERYLERLARDLTLSPAEITRRVGDRAQAAGRPRPSYAAVRLLVVDMRADLRARAAEPGWGEVLLDVAFRARPIGAIEDKAVGLINKHLPEDWGLGDERR
jgi:hypothetical protein